MEVRIDELFFGIEELALNIERRGCWPFCL
jgi:hypothetical protein